MTHSKNVRRISVFSNGITVLFSRTGTMKATLLSPPQLGLHNWIWMSSLLPTASSCRLCPSLLYFSWVESLALPAMWVMLIWNGWQQVIGVLAVSCRLPCCVLQICRNYLLDPSAKMGLIDFEPIGFLFQIVIWLFSSMGYSYAIVF